MGQRSLSPKVSQTEGLSDRRLLFRSSIKIYPKNEVCKIKGDKIAPVFLRKQEQNLKKLIRVKFVVRQLKSLFKRSTRCFKMNNL